MKALRLGVPLPLQPAEFCSVGQKQRNSERLPFLAVERSEGTGIHEFSSLKSGFSILSGMRSLGREAERFSMLTGGENLQKRFILVGTPPPDTNGSVSETLRHKRRNILRIHGTEKKIFSFREQHVDRIGLRAFLPALREFIPRPQEHRRSLVHAGDKRAVDSPLPSALRTNGEVETPSANGAVGTGSEEALYR